MTATSAERILYASRSRKWNSTQCPKFLTEFPAEHAANLEWIGEAETTAVRQRIEQENKAREESQARIADGAVAMRQKERNAGRGKWILLGALGIILAMRAWQRYKENNF